MLNVKNNVVLQNLSFIMRLFCIKWIKQNFDNFQRRIQNLLGTRHARPSSKKTIKEVHGCKSWTKNRASMCLNNTFIYFRNYTWLQHIVFVLCIGVMSELCFNSKHVTISPRLICIFTKIFLIRLHKQISLKMFTRKKFHFLKDLYVKYI